jgi:hypothetical protein
MRLRADVRRRIAQLELIFRVMAVGEHQAGDVQVEFTGKAVGEHRRAGQRVFIQVRAIFDSPNSLAMFGWEVTVAS